MSVRDQTSLSSMTRVARRCGVTGLGQQDQFTQYIAEVRKTHKPKRNFMAMLDRLD
jgi:hypothetical protein